MRKLRENRQDVGQFAIFCRMGSGAVLAIVFLILFVGILVALIMTWQHRLRSKDLEEAERKR